MQGNKPKTLAWLLGIRFPACCARYRFVCCMCVCVCVCMCVPLILLILSVHHPFSSLPKRMGPASCASNCIEDKCQTTGTSTLSTSPTTAATSTATALPTTLQASKIHTGAGGGGDDDDDYVVQHPYDDETDENDFGQRLYDTPTPTSIVDQGTTANTKVHHNALHPRSSFQNGAKPRDLRHLLHPSLAGAECKTRLESGFFFELSF